MRVHPRVLLVATLLVTRHGDADADASADDAYEDSDVAGTDVANKSIAVFVSPAIRADSTGLFQELKRFMGSLDADATADAPRTVDVQFYQSEDLKPEILPTLSAAVTITTCRQMWRLHDHLEPEQVLHLAVTDTHCSRLHDEAGRTVPHTGGNTDLVQLVSDLFAERALVWDEVTVLHDGSMNGELVDEVVSSLSGALGGDLPPVSVSVVRLNAAKHDLRRQRMRRTLDAVPRDPLGIGNFLVLVQDDIVPLVMDVAKECGLVTALTQWLYVVTPTDGEDADIADVDADAEDANDVHVTVGGNETRITERIEEGDNISFLVDRSRRGAMCNDGMLSTAQSLLRAALVALTAVQREEMALAGRMSREEWSALRPTRTAQLRAAMARIPAQQGHCSLWRLFAADTWGIAQPRRLRNVGKWRKESGLRLRDLVFPHVGHGFRGRNLALVSFHNPPWQILKLNATGHLVSCSGLVFEVVDELSRTLNFSYTVYMTRDLNEPSSRNVQTSYNLNQTLSRSAGGRTAIQETFSDVVSIVGSRKAFLGASAFTVSKQKDISFTSAISIQPFALLSARPAELSRALLFMSPFTIDTWLCIAASALLVAPLLRWVHLRSADREHPGSRHRGLGKMFNCLWYVYGALLQQGGTHVPRADSARIVVGAWWLVVVVVVTTYCGNLVAFLTFPKTEDPLRSVDHLLELRDTHTWGVLRGAAIEHQLLTAEEDKYRTLLNDAARHEELNAQLVERVRRHKHVLVDWKVDLLFVMRNAFLETDTCDFSLGEQDFLEEKLAMLMVRDSPYLALVDREIQRMHQVGLINKWLQDHLPKRDKCWRSSKVALVSNRTVNLDDMQGCFFVLLLGCLFAGVAMVLERRLHMWKLDRQLRVVGPYLP